MTTYTWTGGPAWINNAAAWGPNGLPGVGDAATISTGLVYDWNMPTQALYEFGNQNAAQAPLLYQFGVTAINAEVVGYANFVNFGYSTINANVGTGMYWESNQGGFLNLYNYGTLHGSLDVNTVGGSVLNLLGGGSFGGAINFGVNFHGGSEPISIQNNLLPGTAVYDSYAFAGNGPGEPITFSGRADSSDVFHLGGDSQLNLTQMQFLPNVSLESDFARVTFDNWFSNNLQAIYHAGVLTIRDFGLGRSLSLNVSLPTNNVFPGGGLTLFEPQHTGATFYGLTLGYSTQSGPGTLHPLIY